MKDGIKKAFLLLIALVIIPIFTVFMMTFGLALLPILVVVVIVFLPAMIGGIIIGRKTK